MKLMAVLVFMILFGLAVPGAWAADVMMTEGLIVGGSFTANSFICADGVPCFSPAGISPGNANIDISGNAATCTTAGSVTDGVYSTGFYADPSWITSLAGSKITGNIPGNAATCTTAGSVTDGVYSTGSYSDPSWITSLDASKITGANPVADGSIIPANIAFYDRVAIVATTGGDYSNPATAMTNYSAWCPSPTAGSPCLLKIMPGVYTVTSAVAMQPYIDIEGSGEKVTKITGAINGTALPPTTATVMGADDAELRFLTIENTGTGTVTAAVSADTVSAFSLLYITASASGAGGTRIGVSSYNSDLVMKYVTASAANGAANYGVYFDAVSVTQSSTMMNMKVTASSGTTNNYGVYMQGSPSPSLTNVTASASGGTTSRGIYNSGGASPTLTNVTVTASAATSNIAVYNDSSSPTLTTVTATASGGTNNYGIQNVSSGTVRVNHSVIKGTKSVVNAVGVTTYVGNTQLDGTVDDLGGTAPLTCVGAYNASYAALDADCIL